MEPPVVLDTNCGRVDWRTLKATLAADDFDNGRSPEQLERSFRASARTVFAWQGDAIVGTGRVLSDGVCNAYVIDLWTHSPLRRRGIARRMLHSLLEPLRGQHVYLFTDDAEAFYVACGFVRRGVGLERVVGTWLDAAVPA